MIKIKKPINVWMMIWKEIGDVSCAELNENKEKIKLDLDCLNFEKQCYLINEILIK